MIEIVLFAFLFCIVTGVVIFAFDLRWLDPRIPLGIMVLFLIPGIYAAFTSAPFVPSARKRHKTMIKLANLQPSDVAYDLGCGDGRLVFESARHVQKAIGYDLSIPLVLFAKLKAFLIRSKAIFHFGNLWSQDYQDATVIYCYLFPTAMRTLYKEIWPKLKKGTRVISNAFPLHEITPVQVEEKVYLYVKD